MGGGLRKTNHPEIQSYGPPRKEDETPRVAAAAPTRVPRVRLVCQVTCSSDGESGLEFVVGSTDQMIVAFLAFQVVLVSVVRDSTEIEQSTRQIT